MKRHMQLRISLQLFEISTVNEVSYAVFCRFERFECKLIEVSEIYIFDWNEAQHAFAS